MKFKFLMLCSMLISISCYSGDEVDNIEARIVGGTPAHDGQAPYQCSLQLKAKSRSNICGCAIISSEWVLTAAHCLKASADFYKIMVGSNDLDSGGTTYDAVQHIINDKFEHDIALIRVRGPIQFNSKVQPIKYSTVEVPPGTELLATGWGKTSEPGIGSRHLQAIKLKVVSDAECKKAWAGQIHASMLCTYTRSGEGMCHGDSGGPLVWDNTLVGLVSFGEPCAIGIPDVFTKVSYFYDWIKSHTS